MNFLQLNLFEKIKSAQGPVEQCPRSYIYVIRIPGEEKRVVKKKMLEEIMVECFPSLPKDITDKFKSSVNLK